MSLEYKPEAILLEEDQYSFLKLGPKAEESKLKLIDFQRSKHEEIDGIWGTLGYADNRKLKIAGTVEFSENGNIDHTGVTKQIAVKLNEQNIDINSIKDVKEKFIDLSKIEFKNIPDSVDLLEEIQLQFNLKLEATEGALVYLETYPDGKRGYKDAFVRLITPEFTGTNSVDRRSLTYLFEYDFGKRLVYKPDDKIYLEEQLEGEVTKTALKILTFKRLESDFSNHVKSISKQINVVTNVAQNAINKVGEKKYQLYLFDKTEADGNKGGSFKTVTTNISKIDPKKKTLLLIHGTFSTIDGSFCEMLEARFTASGTKYSFLQKLLQEGIFEQVIGFDHPTASHSVIENVDWLLEMIRDIQFKQKVDIITTSRGALLAENLVSRDHQHIMLVGRVMMFAPAHGSDLLKVAKGLDIFLSIMTKSTSAAGLGFILGVAQFSIKTIRTQSGLEDMYPNGDSLTKLMAQKPKYDVTFKAMVGDYSGLLFTKDKVKDKLFKNVKNKGKKIMMNSLDGIVRAIFRSETDWVIGVPEQRAQLNSSTAIYSERYEYYCLHGKQFDKTHPKDKTGKTAKVFDEIIAYFHDQELIV